ncbi:MAG: glutaredoxin family protein [Acidobacteria bacterium]|nr:MAG: glutaredoxin family protein [Acidobacteriota bacterium]MCL4286449.1 glutaredoxin family protein [Thermoleophilia bacterium]
MRSRSPIPATSPSTPRPADVARLAVVTLYGRAGCHLCEEARAGLEALRRDGLRFTLREVDIESDRELHRRLLELIPVVEVDGARVSELLFDADRVRSRLDTFPA